MCQTVLLSEPYFLHKQVSVSLEKWEALCILMQYKIELI